LLTPLQDDELYSEVPAILMGELKAATENELFFLDDDNLRLKRTKTTASAQPHLPLPPGFHGRFMPTGVNEPMRRHLSASREPDSDAKILKQNTVAH
jgi:hypothetical protein